jgi:hypothetical protein
MTISEVQTPPKLSLDEIIEVITQLSLAERAIVISTLKRIGLYEVQPLPYVIQLEPGKTIEQIFKERGYKSVNWARVDQIAKEFKEIDEPNIIKLHDDKPIDEQLDEIWQKRGPIDWSIIDDISAKMDIQEPIEELLQSLTT